MNATVLPSRRRLLVSTLIALAAAAVILVVVVLPAEYGVDPTKLGGVLGLTAMGESKSGAAPGVAVPPEGGDSSVMHAHKGKWYNGRVEINLAGYEELEYKATLAKGESLLHSWTTQGGPLYFEFHGEPTEGKWPKDYYQSYEIVESAEKASGSFTAPFTGKHGWYWRNPSGEEVTIVLEAAGYYTSLARIEAADVPQ